MHRRTFLGMVCSAVGVAACGARAGDRPPQPPLVVSDDVRGAEWKELLTPNEFYVLREKGTERAFSGDLWDHKGDGLYICAGCGLPLYDSSTKFRSGTGWPSFFAPLAADRVAEIEDRAFGMVRTETVCARCGGHLGHVFPDGPKPTGQRYCMNSASLDFVPRKEAKKLKGEPLMLGGWSAIKGVK